MKFQCQSLAEDGAVVRKISARAQEEEGQKNNNPSMRGETIVRDNKSEKKCSREYDKNGS